MMVSKQNLHVLAEPFLQSSIYLKDRAYKQVLLDELVVLSKGLHSDTRVRRLLQKDMLCVN